MISLATLLTLSFRLPATSHHGSSHGLIGRRNVAALLGLPILGLQPLRAHALFGDEAYGIGFLDGLQGDLRNLANTQLRLKQLAKKLKSEELRGSSPEDAIVVLQTLTIQFGGTVKLMEKASASMPKLDATETGKLAVRLADELEGVRQGCREKSAEKQITGVEGASGVIDQYLALAANQYKIPGADPSLEYPKDAKEFAATYYGIFSCEGQGLERIPGSNSCKDTGKNRNPFPTKNLLEFDALTGAPKP